MKRSRETILSRRKFLELSTSALIGSLLPGALLTSCSKTLPPLRIGSNIWPGYELLFLARELQILDDTLVNMIELPSASVCLEALAAETIDGACLTLDEVLTAKSEGLDLVIVTILDISMGADVILSNSKYKNFEQLKGKRIGVEQSAVGAVMLHSAIEKHGLNVSDFEIVHMNVNHHLNAFLQNQVDALVTFEPVVSQLEKHNALKLFSSADIPGRIVDVIAVRPDVITKNPDAVRNLVASHFSALQVFLNTPKQATPIMAKRLKLEASEVVDSYKDLVLPNIEENQKFLHGKSAELHASAEKLATIMTDAKLLQRKPDTSNIINGDFLPG
ncbi:MAG: ABC transporter substrate-binding protein [Gammaproteobacteria bacterium]|nr:ABC transporter substrate-binding protein [Gammaproteobacteria bacterium]